jgi:YidC/Oxa1 family membrane protein insertase
MIRLNKSKQPRRVNRGDYAGMENKNLILALILILAVWFGSNLLFPQPQKTGPKAKPESSVAVSQENPKEKEIPEATVAPLPAEHLAEAPGIRDLTVDTDLFRAVFTTSGGRLKSLTLKQYQQTTAADSPLVSLVGVQDDQLATLRTQGSGDFDLSPGTVYTLSEPEDILTLSAGEERQVVFSARTRSGLRVDKIFTFRGDAYDFNLQVRLTNLTSQSLRGALNLALVQPWDESMEGSRYSFVGPAVFQGEKVHTYKVKKIEENAVEFGKDAIWTAFERKYFMAAAVPLEGGENFRVAKNGQTIENSIATGYKVLGPEKATNFNYLLYYGPRDLQILERVDHQLEKAIDFGFFGIIARPLLSVLKFFYQYVGNYGVAIILLTVIIKLLFWPLTRKSYQSMKSMQTLQPEMQKIREKYKNDKERMNREIMELYKSKRVNPMGGCLPMFVQIPVFFALYKVLLGTIEIRHAPFIFWIQDLAAKDPYYITPVIMGVTMFLQQKMSPSTMDPNQAKIFMFMPIIFTFMFLNFPSGLVLYWLVNNLLTILQQWFINREGKAATA